MSRPPEDDAILRARSYDDVAEAYERVNAPLLFDAPARGLVECAAPKPGEHVLDVGAGTGAVARAALATGARVVALDPSLPMLEAAGRGGVANAVVGALPHLPFLDAVFDRVCSAFVLTHVDDPGAAVRDMHRVLRPGGCVALSAWAPADDEYSAAWERVVHEFVDPRLVSQTAEHVLPGEPRFQKPNGQSEFLEANGFREVRNEIKSFTFSLTVDEMISTREVCATGRALRLLLTDDAWNSYRSRVREVLGKQFPDGIRYDRRVYIAVGLR